MKGKKLYSFGYGYNINRTALRLLSAIRQYPCSLVWCFVLAVQKRASRKLAGLVLISRLVGS
jgi:hypothetical protein